MKWILPILLTAFIAASAKANPYDGCFIPGETAEYRVSWMKIPIAWSKISTETFSENGKKWIRLTMVSKNYKAYEHIYKVDDITEVVIDPETALPCRVDLVLNEGRRHKSELTYFDHENLTATHINRLTGTTNHVTIAEDTRDVLTFLYASRLRDPEELVQHTHQLFVDGKIYDLDMKIGEEDSIRLPNLGKVDSFKIEPVANFDGLFIRQGKILFWVSKHNHRMVTCIEAKVSVGEIKVRLKDVSGIDDGFWSHKKDTEKK
ncbi:MAG TPA: DUF3108 domain-containing protein [Pontiella sp.]